MAASTPSALEDQRIRAAVGERRQPLPGRQRKFKGGTTSFMLAMHVGAVFALL
ncbi:MAG: acyl-CoA desaturase, partial [Cyanobium sp. MAG_216]|nr:acyl-CoA desaturase [Cyanobium sp. MAG_216]